MAASEEEVEEERARIRRRLREEQDAEYQATLVNDQVCFVSTQCFSKTLYLIDTCRHTCIEEFHA